MNADVDLPYEFEALALYMGTTPKKAAEAVIKWFAAPLRDSGLVHAGPDYPSPQTLEFIAAAGSYAHAVGLDRSDALMEIRQAA